MIVINKNTRQDVTTFFYQYMEGKLTKAEFEMIAGATPKHYIKCYTKT
tara:strand:+ start:528 stop:671 length:144 start_codon:yes stop_codon:yes gene_type:complete